MYECMNFNIFFDLLGCEYNTGFIIPGGGIGAPGV